MFGAPEREPSRTYAPIELSPHTCSAGVGPLHYAVCGYEGHSTVDQLQGETYTFWQRELDHVRHAASGADTLDRSVGSETLQFEESTPVTEQLL